MIKTPFVPLAVILLTSSISSSPPPKAMDLGSSLGYFSDFSIAPFEPGYPYSIKVKYRLFSSGTHRLMCGWNSETSTFSEGGTMFSFFPIPEQYVSGSAGDVFVFDYYVPGKYVCRVNEMTFIDYDVLGDCSTYSSIYPSQKENFEIRDLGKEKSIHGNLFYDVNYMGQFIPRRSQVNIVDYRETLKSDSRGIIPFDKIRLDYINGPKEDPADNNLTLIISGDSFMDFEELLGHGGFLSSDQKSIEVPLKWKKDNKNMLYPVLDEMVFGYDFGSGALPYQENLPFPKSEEKYPTYHMEIRNTDDELGSYFYEFNVEKGEDFFGSCRNSDWCVGII